MKQKITRSCIILLIMILVFSCSEPPLIENILIGTWKHMDYQSGDWEKISFNEDLSYCLENYDGETYQTLTLTGTYRYDEELVIFERPGYGDTAYYYTVSGDSLTFSSGRTYLRQ